jgi:hypothetical protein
MIGKQIQYSSRNGKNRFSISRRTRLTGVLLTLPVLLLGAITFNISQNQSAVYADTGVAILSGVTITQVGTGQAGEDASHVLNNNVVKYSANYNFTTAGTVTVTATLPSGGTWAAVTVSAANGCTTGSSISGNVATCILSAPLGMASWSLSVNAMGGNGDTVRPTFTGSSGSTASANPVTIIGAPDYSLVMASTEPRAITAVSGTGQDIGIQWGLRAPLSAHPGGLGLEPLAGGNYSFTIDTSTLPTTWNVPATNCVTNRISSDYGSGSWPGITGSTGRGTVTCTKVDNQTLRISVSGAYSGGPEYPTRTNSNGIITDYAYYSLGQVNINIPLVSLVPGGTQYTVTASNLVASGLSGAINPGVASGSATASVTSSPVYVVHGDSFDGYNANWTNSWGSPFPLYAGQTFVWKAAPRQVSAAGVHVNNPQVCQVFDPTTMELISAVPNAAFTSPLYTMIIEYGVGVPSNIDASCGKVGDGATGWFSDISDARAAGAIRAVRIKAEGYLESNSQTPGILSGDQMSLANLTFKVPPNNLTATALPTGTHIPYVACFSSDENGRTCTSGRYHVAVEAGITHTVAVSNDTQYSPTVAIGGVETVTLTQTVSGTGSARARGATEIVTLPASLSYVGGSTTFQGAIVADPAITSNPDGTTTLEFALGDLPVGQTKLVFKVNVSTAVIMPSRAQIDAVVASAEAAYLPLVTRQRSAAFDIAAPATLGFNLSQSASTLQPGDDQTYFFTAYNTRPEAVTNLVEVAVLPYNGDVNGTSGLTSYRLDSLTASGGVTLYYTTDTAVRNNPSSVVNWTTYSGGNLPDNVTAVRWTLPTLASGANIQIAATLTDIEADNNAIIGNAVAYASSNLGELNQVAKLSADYKASIISGVVYRDVDLSGDLSAGDSRHAGLTVELKKDDQVIATTVTNMVGSYNFKVAAGNNYRVVLANTPSGEVSNLDAATGQFNTGIGTGAADNNFGFVAVLAPRDDSAELTIAPDGQANMPIEIPVITNDQGPDGTDSNGLTLGTLLYESAADNCALPKLGTVEIRDGQLFYTPNAGATGTDEFCYEISDSFGQKSFARVTIKLDAPEMCVYNPAILASDEACMEPAEPIEPTAPTIPAAPNTGLVQTEIILVSVALGIISLVLLIWGLARRLTRA